MAITAAAPGAESCGPHQPARTVPPGLQHADAAVARSAQERREAPGGRKHPWLNTGQLRAGLALYTSARRVKAAYLTDQQIIDLADRAARARDARETAGQIPGSNVVVPHRTGDAA